MNRHVQQVTRTSAELVVRALEQQGVTHVFGVPGAKIDTIFNALVDSKIETVVCRHEQNAGFIAGAIGRMTGKAGVAIATSGPGVSNLTTALATANTEGDPVVAFGGAVALADSLKHVHQTMDAVFMWTIATTPSSSNWSIRRLFTDGFVPARARRGTQRALVEAATVSRESSEVPTRL